MLFDTIGWLGSILVVLAYTLNIFGKLPAQSSTYHWLNIAGSLGLATNTIYHHALPSSVVNIIWIGIALVARLKTAPNVTRTAKSEKS